MLLKSVQLVNFFALFTLSGILHWKYVKYDFLRLSAPKVCACEHIKDHGGGRHRLPKERGLSPSWDRPTKSVSDKPWMFLHSLLIILTEHGLVLVIEVDIRQIKTKMCVSDVQAQ